MIGPYTSPIVRFGARLQAPLLQLYALYVLFHGHYSPGGGFQAGAALAGSYLLPRLAEGRPAGDRGMTTRRATTLSVLGVAVYALTGLASLLLGGTDFLDYAGLAALPWPMPEVPAARAVGTLTVEVGVTMTVTGVMITLYDDLVSRPRERA